jgi:hypothetical protein
MTMMWDDSHYEEARGDYKIAQAHRQPTTAEIRFGYGCTIYVDVPLGAYRRKDGTLKRRITCPETGKHLYRW